MLNKITTQSRTNVIPRLHDEAGSTSWLYESSTSARRALVELAWWAGYLVIWMA